MGLYEVREHASFDFEMKMLFVIIGCYASLFFSCNNHTEQPKHVPRQIELGCCQVLFKNVSDHAQRIYLTSHKPETSNLPIDDFVLNPGEYRIVTSTDTMFFLQPALPLFSSVEHQIARNLVQFKHAIPPGVICEVGQTNIAIYNNP